jgi:hypothetical protein
MFFFHLHIEKLHPVVHQNAQYVYFTKCCIHHLHSPSCILGHVTSARTWEPEPTFEINLANLFVFTPSTFRLITCNPHEEVKRVQCSSACMKEKLTLARALPKLDHTNHQRIMNDWRELDHVDQQRPT